MRTRKLFFAAGAMLGAFLLATSYRSEAPMDAVALGKALFEDPMLSSNGTQSCASCHIPAFAFGDTSAVSVGAEGKPGTRNTPMITNMTYRGSFFWDGRAATLEEQVLGPIANPVEMNLPVDEAIRRLRNNNSYVAAFMAVYGRQPDSLTLASALSAFVRTLETSDSAFDRWMRGDTAAMSASAIRGRDVFLNKGKCFDCHFGPDFTGDEFRNIGLYDGKIQTDQGRYAISKNPADMGKFKVPGLRNVAVSAPYMHNGSFKTLRQVIDYYDNPAHFEPDAINRDALLAQPLNLTAQEKDDLEAFLVSLTDSRFIRK